MNRLSPVETSFQFVLKEDRQSSAQFDETNTTLKQNVVDLAKLPIKYASGISKRGGSLKILV